MKIRLFVTALVLFLVTALVAPNMTVAAPANPGLLISSGFSVNYDFSSGSAGGSGSGANAMPTQISSGVDYWLNQSTNQFHIATTMSLSGIWGNPTASNPWYDLMQSTGLTTFSEITLNTLNWNGNSYDFEQDVQVYVQGYANVSRYTDPNTGTTSMDGWFSALAQGHNAIPINSTSIATIYDHTGGPSDRDPGPDWNGYLRTEWIVTTPWTVRTIPAPSSAALLGIGGLIASRRRRV